jgi:paraquat-inducible protein B
MIGGFVVSGIVLTVAGVILFGSGRMFDETRSYVSFFPGSVNGLVEGANVSFRGVPIGTVQEVLLAMNFEDDAMSEDMRVPVVFEIDLTRVASLGVQGDLEEEDRMQLLLDRGLSARLDTESFLTGRLYVSLDFRPNTDRFLLGTETEYVEIPSVRSPFAEIQEQFHDIADNFIDMDVDDLLGSLRATLDGMNQFMTSEQLQGLPGDVDRMVDNLDLTLESVRSLTETVEASIGPLEDHVASAAENAERSMEDVDQTLESLRGVMGPDAPLIVSLVGTLQELEAAARSLRRVSDLIERDPSILVRGRATGGGS